MQDVYHQQKELFLIRVLGFSPELRPDCFRIWGGGFRLKFEGSGLGFRVQGLGWRVCRV